ncbi:MAG: hypothetical protein Q9213_001011 [Squamulea squamosa]
MLNLPYEILLRIIEHELCPKDLENFTLSSKRIYHLSTKALARHRMRKRKYSTFVVGDVQLYHTTEGNLDPLVPREQHPVLALQRMLEDTTIPAYCKILGLGGVDGGGHTTGRYEENVVIEARRVNQDMDNQLVSLFGTEPYHQYINAQRWMNIQLTGMCDLAYYAPLSSLSSIRTLELVNCSDFIGFLPLLPTMRETHHYLNEIGFFGKRNTVNSKGMKALCTLATLPSVRKIYGLYVNLSWDLHDYRDCVRDLPYLSVKELHFECSTILGLDFEKLLSRIKALGIFYYDNDQFSRSDYGPRRILAALQGYASETLESLTFTDRYWMPCEATISMRRGHKKYTGSLKEFKVLKHIAIECSILINEQKDGLVLPRGDSRAKRGRGVHVPRLVDVLPPSIETLELYRPKNYHMTSMFSGLKDLREERLPNLRSISIQRTTRKTRIKREIREDCHDLGIGLAFVGGPKQWWPNPAFVRH